MNKAVLVVSALRGGGAEKFVLNLYRALEKYQGYECHIISIEKSIQYDISGYRVHFVSDICNISKKGWRRLFYRENIASAIDNFIVDKIGKNALILSNMILSDKIMSKSKLNVYHVIHNAYSTSLLQGKSKIKQFNIIRGVNKVYNNHPLIFVSEAAKESYYNRFHSNQKSYVIYNPINVEEINDLSNEFCSGVEGDYIIHVGRFNRAKRHDRLISIFSELKNKKVKLVLLGDGELKASINEQVKKYNLEDRVIFLGFKNNPYPYIKNAKALVLTSDFEGLPTVLLEAMALNIPVISMNCPGGISEIIDKETDSICNLDNEKEFIDKIDICLDDPTRYKTAVKGCFSPECAAFNYHKLNKQP